VRARAVDGKPTARLLEYNFLCDLFGCLLFQRIFWVGSPYRKHVLKSVGSAFVIDF
jgi:hypothetical protein